MIDLDNIVLHDDATPSELRDVALILIESIKETRGKLRELIESMATAEPLPQVEDTPRPVYIIEVPENDVLEGYRPLPIKDKTGKPKWQPGPNHRNESGTLIVGQIYETEVPQRILDIYYAQADETTETDTIQEAPETAQDDTGDTESEETI